MDEIFRAVVFEESISAVAKIALASLSQELKMPRYTQDQWNALLAVSIDSIKSLATLKGGEYAGDTDRLANFRRNGEALGLPMETIWAVYAGKHWDAIQQYIKDFQAGKSRTRAEPIAGRVDDLLVYLLLFKAMLEERAIPHPAQQAEQ